MKANNKGRIERNAVRVVLVDSAQSVLLISTRDASNPNFGASWELPGGGIIRGESIAEAAVREVREETGLNLKVSGISVPLWWREVLYTYRGERRLQREAICAVTLSALAPRIDDTGREAVELEDHLLYRWWPIDELRRSNDRFYPKSLPQHIDALIAGLHIHDPVETWEESQ